VEEEVVEPSAAPESVPPEGEIRREVAPGGGRNAVARRGDVNPASSEATTPALSLLPNVPPSDGEPTHRRRRRRPDDPQALAIAKACGLDFDYVRGLVKKHGVETVKDALQVEVAAG